MLTDRAHIPAAPTHLLSWGWWSGGCFCPPLPRWRAWSGWRSPGWPAVTAPGRYCWSPPHWADCLCLGCTSPKVQRGEGQREVYSQGLTLTRTDPTMACWTTSGQGVVAIWEDLEMYWLCSCCISGCLSQLYDSLELQTISFLHFVNSRIYTGKKDRGNVGGWVTKRL